MIRKPISEKSRVAIALSSLVLLVAAYSIMCWCQKIKNPKDKAIPNAVQFYQAVQTVILPDDGGEVWLWEDATATFERLFFGVVVGVVASICVGMAMGCFPLAESFFILPLSFFARIPPTAMMAVYFVLFGIEMPMYTSMIALGIFPTLSQAIYQAAKNDVKDLAIYKAYTLGAKNVEVIYNVVFQQILPRVIENVRLMIGPAMVFLIAAEWNVADVGFGYRLRIQSRLTNMNVVYTYLIILGVVGYVLDWFFLWFRRYWCPWFGEQR